ncbi:MAG TPA: hypothetical protein PLM53_00855 [Spirochaetota bacterium]|nr:hypothetical protein [Spirochaetota bacterium]HPC39429.1 hypothetical protein [Spirochaetota bacterium]HPL17313.1 hypothetical protein [Spirochaetota bacterium]HQF06766.1 hypothetical protein [Spirochaetota bacterium]HQH95615.1 hypothetical protein [Spirochaetota bacterium]
MKNTLFALISLAISASVVWSADTKKPPVIKDMESLEGITHYGMPIEEISKSYRKDESVLNIIYSKTLSDDNMDSYVRRFYDEFLRQIEKWLYENKLPLKDMRIVISNCKFCKIGYCKKKNIREMDLVLYSDGTSVRHLALKHDDIIDKNKYIDIARSAVIIFLDKQ